MKLLMLKISRHIDVYLVCVVAFYIAFNNLFSHLFGCIVFFTSKSTMFLSFMDRSSWVEPVLSSR